MATLKNIPTNYENVIDKRYQADTNDDPNVNVDELNNKLKMYGSLSEKAKLDWDPLTFNSFGKLMRTSNRQLATAVREYYGKTFHDIRGVNLSYVSGIQAPFVFEFYFAKNNAPKPDGKMDNLVDLTTPTKGDQLSYYYQKQIVDNKAAGKHYTLNDETKLLLGDIMFGGKDGNKPNNGKWNNYIQEVWVPTSDWTFNQRAGELLIKVSGCFDIRRILQKLFGNSMVTRTEVTKDANGSSKIVNHSAEPGYEARFIKYAWNEPSVFIMNIEQFDRAAVEEITTKENPIRRSTVSGVVYY